MKGIIRGGRCNDGNHNNQPFEDNDAAMSTTMAMAKMMTTLTTMTMTMMTAMAAAAMMMTPTARQ